MPERPPSHETASTTEPLVGPQASSEGFAAARGVLSPQAHDARGLFTAVDARTREATQSSPRGAVHTLGDLLVAEGATVGSSLSTEGRALVGTGAHLRGSLYAAAGADIGERARIDGELDVTGTLQWGTGARAGRVKVEGAFITGNGEVRAPRLRAKGGIQVGEASPEGSAPGGRA